MPSLPTTTPSSFSLHTSLSLPLSLLPSSSSSSNAVFLRSHAPIPAHSAKSSSASADSSQPTFPRCYAHIFSGDSLTATVPFSSKLLASTFSSSSSSYVTTTSTAPFTFCHFVNNSLVSTFALSDASVHGDVVLDDWFGGASLTDSHLIYCAHAPISPLASSFTPFAPGKEEGGGDDSVPRGGTNVVGVGVLEDQGETYTGQPPRANLYVLDLSTGAVSPLTTTPFYSKSQDGAAVSVNHPDLCLKSGILAYTVHRNPDLSQRAMGSVYCSNRPCGVYTQTVALSQSGALSFGEPVHLSSSFALARGAVVSPTGSVVYLSSVAGFDQHNSAFAVTVGEAQVTPEEVFPLGVSVCAGGEAVVAGRAIVTVNAACNHVISTVDLSTGSSVPLTPALAAAEKQLGSKGQVTSRSVIAVRNGFLFYKASAPNNPGFAVKVPLGQVVEGAETSEKGEAAIYEVSSWVV